jgi:hypothetical protein
MFDGIPYIVAQAVRDVDGLEDGVFMQYDGDAVRGILQAFGEGIGIAGGLPYAAQVVELRYVGPISRWLLVEQE